METLSSATGHYDPQSALITLTISGVFFIGLLVWGACDSRLEANHKRSKKDDARSQRASVPEAEWNALCARAGAVVEQAISELPPEVGAVASKIPCLFQERAKTESPGYRTMGVFCHFKPGRVSDHNGPIILYLKTIEEVCTKSGRSIEEQVRKTFLHELGHGLGWDEIDLIRNGLPSGKALDQLTGKSPTSPTSPQAGCGDSVRG